MNPSPDRKLGTIALVMDERISREKSQILMRAVNALRAHAQVLLLGGGTTEDELIRKMEDQPLSVVLVPWHRYLTWTRAEAFFGLSRTSGPCYAGYFAEPVRPGELGEPADYQRAMLFDFANLSVSEMLALIRAAAVEPARSGIRPLLEPTTPVYCENWFGAAGHGARMESILALPELAIPTWQPRAAAVRIVLQALWSLVYEEGSGKGELPQSIWAKSPRAYFQFAADRRAMVLRLCTPMISWNPKAAIQAFWPDPRRPTAAAQLLTRYADWVRVHVVSETTDIEVTAGFLPGAPADRAPESMRTLWIEPIAPQLVTEIPFEAPGPQAPHLRPLPGAPTPGRPLGAGTNPLSESDEKAARERFIFNAAVKLRELKAALDDKEHQLQELRMGGIGTAAPLPPADAESLLHAFRERCRDVAADIRRVETELREAERAGGKAVETLRARLASLHHQERDWVDLLERALQSLRHARRTG